MAVSPTGKEAGDVYVANDMGNGGSPTATRPPLGTVSVIGPSNTVVATITVGSAPHLVAVSPTGTDAGDIYVVNDNTESTLGTISGPKSGTVSVIDPQDNTVVVTINVGSLPAGLAVSPTGPEAGDIYVLDAKGLQVLEPGGNNTYTVDTIAAGSSPAGVAVSPTTGDIYVTEYLGKEVAVINPQDNPLNNTINDTISVGSKPETVAISLTGKEAGYIYVTNTGTAEGTVSVINPNNTVVTTITVGVEPVGMAVSPTGPEAGDIYVSTTAGKEPVLDVIDPNTNTVATSVALPGGEVAVSPTGTEAGYIYVTDTAGTDQLWVLKP